jgi:putative permease of the major facilitator superfamily
MNRKLYLYQDLLLSWQLMACLIIAMGIGRFIYTPALPLMQDQLHLTSKMGALVAASNYFGYLIGSILLILKPQYLKINIVRISCLLLIFSLIAIPLIPNNYIWNVSRFIAGMCSAIIFLYVAQIVYENKRKIFTGIVYSGVGIGIFVTGVENLFINDWKIFWLLGAAIIFILALFLINLKSPSQLSQSQNKKFGLHLFSREDKNSFKFLVLSYFVEGMSYIIIATFVSALMGQIKPQLSQYIWLIIGLAAAPSTVVWIYFKKYMSLSRLLILAYVMQFTSALLPLISYNTITLIASAGLFGATFMGITVLTFNIAIDLNIKQGATILTVFYSIGQIVGPLLVALIISDLYTPAFILAAFLLLIAILSSSCLLLKDFIKEN